MIDRLSLWSFHGYPGLQPDYSLLPKYLAHWFDKKYRNLISRSKERTFVFDICVPFSAALPKIDSLQKKSEPWIESIVMFITTSVWLQRLTDKWVHSLWPSDAIWQLRSGSTLIQVMACCLTAPSHYLNQCWLIISKAQWPVFRAKMKKLPVLIRILRNSNINL